MNRLVFLVFLGGSEAGLSKIKDILTHALTDERIKFLRHNYVSDATLREVEPWLTTEAKRDVSLLAAITLQVTISGRGFEYEGETFEVSYSDRNKVKSLLKCLDRNQSPGCFGRSRAKVAHIAKAIAPFTPQRLRRYNFAFEVSRLVDSKIIELALSDSIANDMRMSSQLPPYETLVYSRPDLPPPYSALAEPPAYAAVWSAGDIKREAELVAEVTRICVEKGEERVGLLTNALILLMFSNWKIKQSGSFPDDYKRGSAAELSRLARGL